MKDYLLFSGSSNLPLSESVAKLLGVSLGKIELTRFADGELRPWVEADVRGKSAFVIESLAYPMDEHIMEMTLIGDAIRRSAPSHMIAIIPYMGYARQDKQHRMGEPVSARVIAKFIEISGYDEVICMDLHNDAIVGFFQIPVVHLSALSTLADAIRTLKLTNAVVISPDVGGVKRARNLAYLLDLPMLVMEKKRFLDRQDKTEAMQIIGNVKGKTAIIVDDVISTAGTIANSARALKDAGASSIVVAASHAVLAGDATKNLKFAPIDTIVLTDTIDVPAKRRLPNMKSVSIAPLIADAISSIVA